jgi:hypothetical protein
MKLWIGSSLIKVPTLNFSLQRRKFVYCNTQRALFAQYMQLLDAAYIAIIALHR